MTCICKLLRLPRASAAQTITGTVTHHHGLLSQSLQLVHSCLSYDFIGSTGGSACSGTVCDGSSSGNSLDDLVVVQIPTSWRSIFLDSDTVPLFFRMYRNLSPDLSVLALSCLVQISSIRRSLFTNAERSIFLAQIVSGCRSILLSVCGNSTQTMATTTTTASPTVIGSPLNRHVTTTPSTPTTTPDKSNGSSMNNNNDACNLMNNPEAYHEFCLLLSRLKCSYQLNELLALSDYASFIELLTIFTVQSIKVCNDECSQNSLHYLLALWQRLVASIPYVHPPDSHLLDTVTPQVVNAYIQSCLSTIPNYMNQASIHISRESIRSEKKSTEFNAYSWCTDTLSKPMYANCFVSSSNQNRNLHHHSNNNNCSNNNNTSTNANISEEDVEENNLSLKSECLLDDWITLSQQLDRACL
ncbi:unnamed protein product [Trichobilharzia szidati]|nr:unnamed protein product [Trichobilharzia szidati]